MKSKDLFNSSVDYLKHIFLSPLYLKLLSLSCVLWLSLMFVSHGSLVPSSRLSFSLNPVLEFLIKRGMMMQLTRKGNKSFIVYGINVLGLGNNCSLILVICIFGFKFRGFF